jgi:raffinose/stachyose/melibiose transport system substrate-binding protein
MKKALTLFLVSTLFTGLLAGCNAPGSSSSSESNGGDAKEVELKVFIGQPRFKEQYETYIDQFVEKQKEEEGREVTVKLELPSVNQADQLLKTRLASGDSPDVFALHAINDIPVYDKAGYLEDLSGEPFAEKLYDTVSPAVTKDGRVLALPLETLQWGYIYNKDIFEENGIEVPQTITEMKAVIKTLEDKGITPFIRSYKDSYIPQLFLPLTVGALESTTNKGFIDSMNKNEGSFADLKGMFDIIDLVHAHGTDRPFEVGQDQGAAAFASGEAAMWVQGPWMAESMLSTNDKFNFGVAPLPINDDPNATLIDLSTSTSLAVSKVSEVKDVAKDFVNYVLDEQESSAFYESLGFNPISDVHTFEPYAWLEDSAKYVEEGKVYQDPLLPAAVKSASEKLLQSYYAGDASKEDVIDGLDSAWQEYNKINK